jgi:hypothetical protein
MGNGGSSRNQKGFGGKMAIRQPQAREVASFGEDMSSPSVWDSRALVLISASFYQFFQHINFLNP